MKNFENYKKYKTLYWIGKYGVSYEEKQMIGVTLSFLTMLLLAISSIFLVLLEPSWGVIVPMIEFLKNRENLEMLTYAAAILSAVGVLLGYVTAYIQRYKRAKDLGIPFRQTYTEIRGFFDMLIQAGGALALVGAIPMFLLSRYETLDWVIVAFASSGCTLFGWVVMHRWLIDSRYGDSWFSKLYKKKGKIIALSVSLLMLIGVFLITMISELTNKECIYATGLVVFILCFTTSLLAYIYWFIIRASVYTERESTCEIDGELYLIGMRHSKDLWILIPCVLRKFSNDNSIEIAGLSYFNGKYEIKTLTEVKNIKSYQTALIFPCESIEEI